ncbi:hypothetical protein F3Y22_tig00110469pilonHSYRG00022 [Hibiscus syriacus]|uniref:Chromo domain-containing protein n=1 Tax=Hibiscus syriacus TaxID=106335 RepID=A0A6A3AH33_HIBSY|nr:hypothetical protein F3Y22_tig00110469pilonHSYRG00022 [Hibiscus syriacus]
MENAKKVSIVSVYLSEVALMWWRRRCNNVKHGNAAIETWQEMSLREHVRKFVELKLQVPNWSEEEGFFTFIDGLKPWAKNELRRRGVKELSVALTIVEDKASKSDKDLSGTGKPSNEIDALVDTDTSELFMSEQVAKRHGLHVEKASGFIKTVNAKEVSIAGVAKGIELTMGGWSAREAIKVIPLDDFDFVLGLSFLDRINAFPEVRKEEPTFLVVLVCDDPATTKEVPDVVSHVLAEFKDVMSAKLPKKLPPKRKVYYKIEFVPNAEPPARALYRMTPPELEEMRKQLKDLLDVRYIRPSKSPYGALMLFQKKHDGSLRMCIDYQALNKLTVKNKYMIPLITDLFDQFGGARWFTKLDSRSGYYQFRIAKGDEPKTACVTRYVYLDYIVIYNKTLEEHVEHLKQVFLVLRENELFFKEEKCSFAKTKVHFLGHIVGAPLTELLKKDKTWDWGSKCQSTFDEIKLIMMSEPILVLPDHTKPFEVFTDASDVAIGGFVVFTYNVANNYFLTYKKLSLKQTHWQEFLAEFDLSLEYKPGKVNSMADALSRRYDMEFVSLPMGWMRERIKEGLSYDSMTTSLIELANEGKTRKFWLNRGLLYARDTASMCHNLKNSKHYYWPHMGNDVEAYVKTCLVCQQDKIEQRRPTGLLQPLPIPERPWESLSMDFIDGLPVSEGFSSIMVVIDKLFKYETFIPASKRSETTNQSLFEIVTGQQPLTPNAVGKRTKKWADRKRRDVNFEVGDLVFAKLSGILRNPYHKGLVRRYEGSFKVLKRVGTMAYRLELPSTIKAHPVFHVSLLKPYHQDEDELDRGKSHRAPVGVKVSYEIEVEAIHAERAIHGVGKRPRHKYLVRWKGLPESEGSWEPFEALWQFRDKIDQFHSSRATRASLGLVGENVTDRQPKTEPSSFKAARDYLCHGAPTIKGGSPPPYLLTSD